MVPQRTRVRIPSRWLCLLSVTTMAGGTPLPASGTGLEPPPEIAVVSRATLFEPLDIEVPAPANLEITQLTIEPEGTSGTHTSAGPVLVSVLGGTARRLQSRADACEATSITPGAAWYVPPGAVEEIRNGGPLHLHVQMTSLVSAQDGERAATASPGGCAAALPDGATASDLTRSTIPGPVRIVTDGPIDILTGRGVFRPGTSTGWHRHPYPVLLSIDEGPWHMNAVEHGRCVRKTFSGGTGLLEAVGDTNDGRNDGGATASLHFVSFSPAGAGTLFPVAPPSEC